jgi:farnesyl-diphosphate farnesyltransferase
MVETPFRFRDKIDWLLVRSVSRSFYLTLRLLPRAIRSGITLAYLLARASDTIADTSRAEPSIRLCILKILQDFAQQRGRGCEPGEVWSLAHFQENPGERRLLEQLPALTERLETHPDSQEIREVWSTILEGQIFDLEHSFSAPLRCEQLDRYTFLVAGCVGKFWTKLCFRRIPEFTSLPMQRMEELGIFYGNGLQLINILRDREEDALRGRTYLQGEDVEIRSKEALEAMKLGIEYARAVKRPFLRYATLLPALIGIRTLKLMGRQSGKVKISRGEVRRILIAALPCLWRAQFALRFAERQNFD